MQNAYGSETPGSVDTTFSNFTSTTDSDVNTIAIQSDGKYLLRSSTKAELHFDKSSPKKRQILSEMF